MASEPKICDQLKWYSVGKTNPFDAPILDLRCITLNYTSFTKDKSTAQNYNASRSSDGTEFILEKFDESFRYESSIKYPHNGVALEGIVFKSNVMEVKWDIYAYAEWFYFVRSWSSNLVYKVHYKNLGDELVLDYILTNLDEESNAQLHEQNVHSIMMTHVFNKVWPYAIPKKIKLNSDQEIALYLFSNYGNKATIATHVNVLEIIKNK
ncbi:MAG: hypothetical protein HRU38_18465 [Saccharospirillaceae bacterium]|nr:hypothetical protein [Pseudomonadales bacterium]NRB80622.1 hypothetical protein [Saccharospirillaceae bacterium]